MYVNKYLPCNTQTRTHSAVSKIILDVYESNDINFFQMNRYMHAYSAYNYLNFSSEDILNFNTLTLVFV